MKLRIGYVLSGIVTGLIILFNFLISLPDGNLHITVCNVGQGDATYILFPDGHDMLIDGGPDEAKIMACLGRHMPFWDRAIDLILLTHAEADHYGGLASVVRRFTVGSFLSSGIKGTSERFVSLERDIQRSGTQPVSVRSGTVIRIGSTVIRVIWPSAEQRIRMGSDSGVSVASDRAKHLNDGSIVLSLRYGDFDALFPGDADTRVESAYVGSPLADNTVELLKVPHHGSRTAMDHAFLDWVHPAIAVVSVGKNSFGHPAPEILNSLADERSRVLRTDHDGDIEIVSDGTGWTVRTTAGDPQYPSP